jgi:hypothetical protein
MLDLSLAHPTDEALRTSKGAKTHPRETDNGLNAIDAHEEPSNSETVTDNLETFCKRLDFFIPLRLWDGAMEGCKLA